MSYLRKVGYYFFPELLVLLCIYASPEPVNQEIASQTVFCHEADGRASPVHNPDHCNSASLSKSLIRIASH
jgi:hypothetical protein